MEPKRTRRFFTPEFKKQAAERVIISKEKAIAVAQDLDISVVSLYQWIKEYSKTEPGVAKEAPAASPAPAAEPKAPAEQVLRSARPKISLGERYQRRDISRGSGDMFFMVSESPSVQRKMGTLGLGDDSEKEAKREEQKVSAESEPMVLKQEMAPVKSPKPSEVPVLGEKTDEELKAAMVRNPKTITGPGPVISPLVGAASMATQAEPEEAPAEKPAEEEAPEQGREGRNFQKQRRQKQYENRAPKLEAETTPPIEERPPRPLPTAAEGRSWRVKGALEQRPNYKEENEHYGYVDEFAVPANDLLEVWKILEIMQDKADRRAFADMVHSRQLNVPDEVLADPKGATVPGPNVPNKPWLRKPRMHQVAEEFFQTTPEYAKAVYESYAGLDIRLGKNSDGTPILSSVDKPDGSKEITIDFARFDRFVDDFYGDFVHECKKIMMEMNPKEYSSLNSFIRIPDEPLWNPKLWAGVRTFTWKNGESLSEAWIHYASSLRKNPRNRFF